MGKQNDEQSMEKVRTFVSDLFGENFDKENPIYGSITDTQLKTPSFCPYSNQYIKVAEVLQKNPDADIKQYFDIKHLNISLAELLLYDENLFRLRNKILTKPMQLIDAAKELWPKDSKADDGLQALLEIVALAKKDESHEDLLPTRLHYFVRAQDGLYVCLHKQCPGRREGKPAFFVSRKNNPEIPEGFCPDCYNIKQYSKLVEVVTCRKCGYLFGVLQDLGPRRAQNPENVENTSNPSFDSFDTELGWAGDSFWSYFSVEDDLPFPTQEKSDDEDDIDDLFLNPAKLDWCVICGKKKDNGAGDNCHCETPHLREIKVFHRQRPSDKRENIYKQEKKLLTLCPNCGTRNSSGLEPVRRFQESDDETGLAMAIPLAHFQVSPIQTNKKISRKLLCFTDHRQRAAAFPSLLEEETFVHDMGRKIVQIVNNKKTPFELIALGEYLADIADPKSDEYDSDFFLPVSRNPDDDLDTKGKRNLWIAETFGYFGIPDSARESAEDLGLVMVECKLSDSEKMDFHNILKTQKFTIDETTALLQVLLGIIRQKKAFTLPKGRVNVDDLAFGRVTADISFVLRREKNEDSNGWLPSENKDGSFRNHIIFDYLKRLFDLPPKETISIAENIWNFLISNFILIEKNGRYKLDHEKIIIKKASSRYVCNRCNLVTTYSVKQCCSKKGCNGKLELQPFDPSLENIIARWVAGESKHKFTSLKSEEHTAQINKELARIIEDEFRAEGVNLLSSTTTFEMGINIGDLQKVLLRNAPPTSASYVQRVGRTARGKDKNSVCVTLCRRTKYDADAWNDPPRLISGEVRTPTVFIQNKVIAQKHFNAVVFAKFLRVNISKFGEIKQQIRLESFLPKDSRKNIPESWFEIGPTNIYLNFSEWLDQQNKPDIFQTEIGKDITEPIGNFEKGKLEASNNYKYILDKISEELSELMAERKKLYDRGYQTTDIEQSVKKLLGSDIITILAKRGFLPRYAFPLDVVTLETGQTRWTQNQEVELSRDRGIAIAEFAPGAQVIAHKKVFTSAGLYIVSKADKPERKWFSKCPSCEQIRTASIKESLISNCAICNRSITDQYIEPFVEPISFSILVDKKKSNTTRYRRSTLIRQRQTITHFIDSIDESNLSDHGLFRLALKEDGALFRYNKGQGNEGFILCPKGFDNWEKIIEQTRDICNKCTCETVCYDCLKNYSNQLYYEKLNRNTVIDFLNNL